jgi:dynein light chain Tctex-type 1
MRLTPEEQDKIQIAIDDFFSGKMYEEEKSPQMINDILEKVMEIMMTFKKSCKYILDCVLSQRVGAGMTNFTSCYYDKNVDNIYHFYYPKDKMASGKEKPLIFALISIFALSYSV